MNNYEKEINQIKNDFLNKEINFDELDNKVYKIYSKILIKCKSNLTEQKYSEFTTSLKKCFNEHAFICENRFNIYVSLCTNPKMYDNIININDYIDFRFKKLIYFIKSQITSYNSFKR